ncbi:MAG TPA: Gfo/Idh/MocA family oxidoreductase [Herpetosiphonaceae bacterium]|nr:Gfo/Idh/MocA family oxidoreductase [Herpetosiphonaceae bacterium]
MPERLRVAVVGGGIGSSHITAFKTLPELYEIVAMCDIDRDKAQRVADEHGIPRVSTDLDDLCRMDDLDVIDICTPPHLHFAQIQQVLAGGKHAICEKPLVSSLKEVDELIEAEAQSGQRMMPIFQYRFGHGLQKLKFLIEAGLAGQAYLSTVETSWRRRAEYYAVPWRGKWSTELGGVLLGHAIHAHDMLSYVSGPIKRVFARATTRVNPIEVEDCASVTLEMADGSLASLSATLGSAAEITRHRFCFSGFVAESNTRPYSNSGDPWVFTGDTPELEAQIAAALERFEPLPAGWAGQFYRFYHALQDGGDLPVTLADARTSLELITAMYYSAQTRADVELPIRADHPKYASWLP